MSRCYALALIAGLLVSAGASAQQDVADNMPQEEASKATSTTQASTVTRDANRLAAAITAYNQNANSGAISPGILDSQSIVDKAPSDGALALARALNAYNGEVRPADDVVLDNHSSHSQVAALGREIKRFNQSGGSLAVIDQRDATPR